MLLKKFLNAHSGFNRDDLQDYINLYCFIANPPADKLKKVELLLQWALFTPKALKYRELYSKKDDK